MKRFFLMLAVALMVSGAVWAQSAVNTTSTEARYSAGGFDGDIDNYIDPAFFSTIELNNAFMFVGGFPSGATLTSTNILTAVGKDVISFGFAKALGGNYLAAYYGGALVKTAGGEKTLGTGTNKDAIESKTTWRNNLAVLFGLGSMGFRFDLVMNDTENETEKVDGVIAYQKIENAPAVALKWGTAINDNLFPWISIGFQFPNTQIITNGWTYVAEDMTDPDNPIEEGYFVDSTKTPDKKATISSGAKFELNAGAWYTVSDTVDIWGDLTVGVLFGDNYSGDKGTLQKAPFSVSEPYTAAGGVFSVDLSLNYIKTLTIGDYVSVKLKPNVDASFSITNNNASNVQEANKRVSTDTFDLSAGINIGVQYKYDKIALYTGLGLDFFKWETGAAPSNSSPKDKKDTWWEFSGLGWKSDLLNSGVLGFGLTFTPIEGLVFGTGITLPANVAFNPRLMQVTPGAAPSISAASTAGIWGTTALNITISYRY